MPDVTHQERASTLRSLHDAPEILTLVNVWDVPSARIVAAHPATRAIATASYAVAASFGHHDDLPGDLMLAAVERIAAATDLPVTADLQAGYGNVADTIGKAIDAGVVGANIEDENRPFAEAVEAVEHAMTAARSAGLDEFVLNARTDAFWFATERPIADRVADAIARGRAFLDAGATCVFVPGATDESIIGELVAGIGERKVSLMADPDGPSVGRMNELGVARVSVGPWAMRVAYAELSGLTETLTTGGSLPGDVGPVL